MAKATNLEKMEEYLAGHPNTKFVFEYIEENDIVIISGIEGRFNRNNLILPPFVGGLDISALDENDMGYMISVSENFTSFNQTEEALPLSAYTYGIMVNSDNLFYSSHENVLLNKEMTELIAYPRFQEMKDKIKCKNREYDVPEGVVKISEHAFFLPFALTKLNIPSSVSVIEANMFGENVYITVDERNTTYKSVEGSLYSFDMRVLYNLHYDYLKDKEIHICDSVEVFKNPIYLQQCAASKLYLPKNLKLIEMVDATFDGAYFENIYVSKELMKNIEYKDIIESSCDEIIYYEDIETEV